ncbi:hypothetical protein INP83_01210 [Mucilaginibacter sp. 21P]|uniref:hypothetical protein n=1 Tax=Mucilaginibacter sp. 21P TaxID=2778902 RepID=UPI001C59875D|nr:hypothetical protein [Mucilaginibacter sp. 21P]QXV65745.1 hypothetical protein INP83_01210 [Mucilaginibacter sp. 21P]
MKQFLFLLILALFLLSCKKDNTLPRTEATTSGSKWGIRVGSSAADVYTQLQASAKQNNFEDVDVIGQKLTFSKPEEVQQRLKFYSMLNVQKDADGASIVYNESNVINITGAIPKTLNKWPETAADEIAVVQNEPVDNIYNKLLAIYKLPEYADYTITLAYKSLTKGFDPDMGNYNEWSFYIFKDVKPGLSGRNYVRLIFSSGKLKQIITEYNEFEVYNTNQ